MWCQLDLWPPLLCGLCKHQYFASATLRMSKVHLRFSSRTLWYSAAIGLSMLLRLWRTITCKTSDVVCDFVYPHISPPSLVYSIYTLREAKVRLRHSTRVLCDLAQPWVSRPALFSFKYASSGLWAFTGFPWEILSVVPSRVFLRVTRVRRWDSARNLCYHGFCHQSI